MNSVNLNLVLNLCNGEFMRYLFADVYLGWQHPFPLFSLVSCITWYLAIQRNAHYESGKDIYLNLSYRSFNFQQRFFHDIFAQLVFYELSIVKIYVYTTVLDRHKLQDSGHSNK